MIYFLIPVYNEQENLKLLSESLITCLPESEKHFVFVDDCSTDQTVDTLKSLFPSNSLEIIVKDKNQGPGNSFNIGFNWILENCNSKNDIIVTLEGDNTSDIAILQKMVQISNLGFDLVLASVYAQGGGFDDTGIVRKFLSLFANIFFRFFFNVKILTLSSFYRVYKVDLLMNIKNKYGELIAENGFISMLEILIKIIRSGGSIIEVPMILYSKKRAGKSKMKVFKTFISYFVFLLKSRRLN